MNLKKRIAVGLVAGISVSSLSVKAQMYMPPQWGTGMYGGMQPCPYPIQVGNGAESYLDESRQIQKLLDAETDKLESLEHRQKQMAQILEDATDVVNGTIAARYATPILAHISGQFSCRDYKRIREAQPEVREQAPAPAPAAAPAPAPVPPAQTRIEPAPRAETELDAPKPASGEETLSDKKERIRKEKADREAAKKAKSPVNSTEYEVNPPSRIPASVVEGIFVERAPAAADDGPQDDIIEIKGFSQSQWDQVCNPQKPGGILPVVCQSSTYRSMRRVGSDADCRKAILTLVNGTPDLMKFESEIAASKRRIASLDDDLTTSRTSSIRKSMNRSSTESGVCVACLQAEAEARRRSQLIGLGGVVAGALLIKYDNAEARRQGELFASFNSAKGIGTQPYPTNASNAGAMVMAAGIQGAVAGSTGSGAYGCASGLNGTGNQNGPMGMLGPYGQGYGPNNVPIYQSNSPFSYTPGILGSPQAGGMYMPGVGPWGVNGPGALNQGGYPAPGGPIFNGNMAGGVPGQFGGPGQFGNGQFVNGQFVGNGQIGNGAYGPYTMLGQQGNGAFGQPGSGLGFQNYGQQGFNQFGGAQGVNPFSLQSPMAAQNTLAGLQAEAMSVQSRTNALLTGSSMGGSQFGQFSQFGGGGTGFSQFGGGTGFSQFGGTGFGAPAYGIQQPGNYLSGNLTIGATYNSGRPTMQPSYIPATGGVSVPPSSR